MEKPVFTLVWLLLCVFSLKVSGGELGDITYEINNGEVTITDYDEGAKGSILIPPIIEWLPVTSVGVEAFFDCSSLTSIAELRSDSIG